MDSRFCIDMSKLDSRLRGNDEEVGSAGMTRR